MTNIATSWGYSFAITFILSIVIDELRWSIVPFSMTEHILLTLGAGICLSIGTVTDKLEGIKS